MEERIANLLEELFTTDPDFADCFLVDINHSNKKLEVFVDSDTRMPLERCQRISRYLESYLDEEQPLGESYILEVGSPGVDRPLKFHRQYVKNVGRTLEVTTTEGETYTGVLKTVNDGDLVLEAKVRRQEGKRKKTVVEDITIDFDAIKKSVVKITF